MPTLDPATPELPTKGVAMNRCFILLVASYATTACSNSSAEGPSTKPNHTVSADASAMPTTRSNRAEYRDAGNSLEDRDALADAGRTDSTITFEDASTSIDATGSNATSRGSEPGDAGPEEQASISQLSIGGNSACAITASGGVQCWGENSSGQLGNGSALNSSVPVDVVGLSRGVAEIGVGAAFACARLTSGAVECWGDNFHGQLGIGASKGSNIPTQVTGLETGAIRLAVGAQTACVIITDGSLKCWGENAEGMVGNNFAPSGTPTAVIGLSAVKSISVGSTVACAVTTGGAAYCWGNGAIGNASTPPAGSGTPVPVTKLQSGVATVSVGGQYVCAVMTDGAAKCWGSNKHGELGANLQTGDIAPGTASPVDVVGLNQGVRELSAASATACAIDSRGGVQCWGADSDGQLGNGSVVYADSLSPVPVQVVGLDGGVREISVAAQTACAILDSGKVRCWGGNENGQFGNGTTKNNTSSPVDGL